MNENDPCRVVQTDNLDDDYPNESFETRVIPFSLASKIAAAFNAHWSGDYAARYWKVVTPRYVLKPGFEP